MHAYMVEVCKILCVISKSPLQTSLPIMMPGEILDRHNTKENVRGQARGHVIKEVGWRETRVPKILEEPV